MCQYIASKPHQIQVNNLFDGTVQNYLMLTSNCSILIQKRDKGKVGVPRLRNPVWFVRKARTVSVFLCCEIRLVY